MVVKIDKGVPIPKRNAGKAHEPFPIRDLEVGDSFAVTLPDNQEKRAKLRNSVVASIRYYRDRYQIHCVTRTVEENRKTKLRVWRVEAP